MKTSLRLLFAPGLRAAAFVSLLCTVAHAAHDLSGLKVPEGSSIRVTENTSMKIEMNMNVGPGQTMNQSIHSQRKGVYVDRIVSISDGVVGAIERAYIEDGNEIEMSVMGQTQTMNQPSGLGGRKVLFEQTPRGLAPKSDSLQGMLESARAQAIAHSFDMNASYGTAMYPRREVKVGDAWPVAQDEIDTITRSMNLQNGKGSGEARVVAFSELDGVPVAVVEIGFLLEGALDMGAGQPLSVRFEMKARNQRALDSHIDLRTDWTGSISGSAVLRDGDMEIPVTISGPFTGTTLRELRAAD